MIKEIQLRVNLIEERKEKLHLDELEGLQVIDNESSEEEVLEFLRGKESSSMDGVEEIMNRRINQFGVAQPNIQKDPSSNRLYIELPGVQDEVTVAERLQSTANLQFVKFKTKTTRFLCRGI